MRRLDIEPPQRGEIRALASDLYWARFALPFRLNHINLYILDTDQGWVVIDSGINQAETASHWDALLSGPLSHQPIDKIIITHHHIDHIGYAGTLAERTGAPVYMSEAEYDKAKWLFEYDEDAFSERIAHNYRDYGLSQEQIDRARADKGRFTRYVAPLPPVEYLSAGDVIHSKDGAWEIRIDNGHAEAHIGLTDTLRGLYIAIDFLLPRISPNISVDVRDLTKDTLGHYFTYLNEIAAGEDSWHIFPGHDWPFTQGARRAADLISHHQHRLSQLKDAAQNGDLTVSDAVAVLFGRDFEAHELYFASGEARAHLNHLVAIGEMQMRFDHIQNVTYFALSQP